MSRQSRLHVIFPLILCFLAAGCALAAPDAPAETGIEKNTPAEVVRDWLKFYGKDMRRAARLTTLDFRFGLPKSLWETAERKKIEAIKYRRASSEIIQIREDGDKAEAIVKSDIETAEGAATQTELYLLLRFDGKWLVDDIIVKKIE